MRCTHPTPNTRINSYAALRSLWICECSQFVLFCKKQQLLQPTLLLFRSNTHHRKIYIFELLASFVVSEWGTLLGICCSPGGNLVRYFPYAKLHCRPREVNMTAIPQTYNSVEKHKLAAFISNKGIKPHSWQRIRKYTVCVCVCVSRAGFITWDTAKERPLFEPVKVPTYYLQRVWEELQRDQYINQTHKQDRKST